MKKRIWEHRELNEMKDTLNMMRTVLVGGCFDIIHYGHLTFLQEAKKQGDALIVALESDQFILEKKKRTPIHSQRQRAEILISHDAVDHVLLLPYFKKEVQYKDLVMTLRPTVITVTEGDPQILNKKQFARDVNGEVIVVSSLVPHLSTTSIISYEPISRSSFTRDSSKADPHTN